MGGEGGLKASEANVMATGYLSHWMPHIMLNIKDAAGQGRFNVELACRLSAKREAHQITNSLIDAGYNLTYTRDYYDDNAVTFNISW